MFTWLVNTADHVAPYVLVIACAAMVPVIVPAFFLRVVVFLHRFGLSL